LAGPQRRLRSEFDLLEDAERIVDLDPEMANRALQLRVTEQQQHRYLSRFGSAQRMRAVRRIWEA
jgi:hypothetical protein